MAVDGALWCGGGASAPAMVVAEGAGERLGELWLSACGPLARSGGSGGARRVALDGGGQGRARQSFGAERGRRVAPVSEQGVPFIVAGGRGEDKDAVGALVAIGGARARPENGSQVCQRSGWPRRRARVGERLLLARQDLRMEELVWCAPGVEERHTHAITSPAASGQAALAAGELRHGGCGGVEATGARVGTVRGLADRDCLEGGGDVMCGDWGSTGLVGSLR